MSAKSNYYPRPNPADWKFVDGALHCKCGSCRSYATWVRYERDAGGDGGYYGPLARYTVECTRCGTTLSFEVDRYPGLVQASRDLKYGKPDPRMGRSR